ADGRPIYLKDIWPTAEEVQSLVTASVSAEQFDLEYGRIFAGDAKWKSMPAPTGTLYDWGNTSTYVREPPYFIESGRLHEPPADITGARVLALLGDSITTDHISPAGSIPVDSPAGKYLVEHSVSPAEFNSFGSRRGNHEVMVRGTFGNIRLRNSLVQREGYWTLHMPDGAEMTIFDASESYRAERVPLVVLAGKEYGSGSARDWAGRGPPPRGARAA